MGFQLGRTYVLLFEGSGIEGAEVKLRATSIGTVLRFRQKRSWDEMVQDLVDHLVSWNLEVEGVPLKPVVEDVLASVEEPVLTLIIEEWMKAARGVTAPLAPPSSDGERFPEESIPMEVE